MLLEVLLALALFVTAAAILGASLLTSTATAARVKVESEAVSLAQSKMAEIAAGAAAIQETGATEFGDDLPGWEYEVAVEDLLDTQGLKRVTVTVNYAGSPQPYSYQLTQMFFDQAGQQTTSAPAGGGT